MTLSQAGGQFSDPRVQRPRSLLGDLGLLLPAVFKDVRCRLGESRLPLVDHSRLS